MNNDLKKRLSNARDRLQFFGAAAPPPDPLSLSLWDLGDELAAMTDAERAAKAEELDITIDDLLEMQRQYKRPRGV